MNFEDLEKNHQSPNEKKPTHQRETNQMKQVTPDDIAPRVEEEPTETFGMKLMQDLDNALARDKKEMYENVIKPAKEYLETKEMFGDEGEDAYFEKEIGETAGGMKKMVAIVSPLYNETTDISSFFEDTSDTGFDDDEDNTIQEKENMDNKPITEEISEQLGGIEIKEYRKPEMDNTPVQENVSEKKTKVVSSEEAAAASIDNSQTIVSEREFFKQELDAMFDDDEEIESVDDLDEDTRSSLYINAGYVQFEDDKQRDEYRHEVVRTVTPFNNIINLSEYTVSKKPLSTSQMLKSITTDKNMANWVYQNGNRAFTMSELTGAEIEKVVMNDGSFKEKEENKQILTACRVFYDHIVDKNKPSTFEGWLKTVYWDDFGDHYFGAYRACFTNSNYVPYTCPTCKHTFMEYHELADMVKFDSDEVKDKVARLISRDTTSTGKVEGAVMFQIADNIVISVNKLSIYGRVVELPALPEKLISNFPDLAYLIAYIQDIYIADPETKELRVVDTKPEPNNLQKTVKNKYKVYFDIINSLSSDQYDYLKATVQTFVTETDKKTESLANKIKYFKPASKCPKCKKTIPEIQATSSFLLFIRHRLQTM